MKPLDVLRKVVAAMRELARHTTPAPAVLTMLDEIDQALNDAEAADTLERRIAETPEPPPPLPDGPATAAGAEATGTSTPVVPGDTPVAEGEDVPF